MYYIFFVISILMIVFISIRITKMHKIFIEKIDLFNKQSEEVKEYFEMIHKETENFDEKLEDAIRYNVLNTKIEKEENITYIKPDFSIEIDAPKKTNKQMIYELNEDGKSISQIAKILNCGEREVQFVLKFRN